MPIVNGGADLLHPQVLGLLTIVVAAVKRVIPLDNAVAIQYLNQLLVGAVHLIREAGLLSPEVPLAEFMNRFHGHNERIDIESLKLTTQLWLDVLDRLWV